MTYYPLFSHANVWQIYNAHCVPGPVKKDPRVLLAEGYPQVEWEQRIDNGYPNVFYDEEYGEFRLYYTCFIHDDASARPIEEKRHRVYDFHDLTKYGPRVAGILMATSPDGVHWTRPALGVCDYKGSKENNILIDHIHGASVFKDAREVDPGKRYKMVVRHDAAEQMAVCFSADGVHWTGPINWPEYNPAGDTHNFGFFDEKAGRYALITRTWMDGQRIAARCESDDFLHFTYPVEIYRGSGLEDQLYSMPVFQWNGLYLGFGSIFHDGDRASADFDCVDCELLYSSDGWHFNRACPGKPLIPRGEGKYDDGAPDCGCIYASAPVFQGDRCMIYYFGGNGQHTNFRETHLMRAEIDPHKFAGYAPKDGRGGLVSTRRLRFTGDALYIWADLAENGRLDACVWRPDAFHAHMEPIEGYGYGDARFDPQPDGSLRISFGRPLGALSEGNYVVTFRLNNATLYGYSGDLLPR